MGITLEEIHAETADEDWQSSFLGSGNDAQIVHKLVSLKNLAVYWNNDQKPSQFEDNDVMRSQMANWVLFQFTVDALADFPSRSTRTAYLRNTTTFSSPSVPPSKWF